MARKGKQRKSFGRMKINVGGTLFETTVSTLTRLDNTVLSALVSDRWNQSKQRTIFVDRNPTYFGKVLDYLRDGENFAPPTDRDARESLRREAEFYNLPGLAEMCSPGLRMGDWVMWKESAVEAYWKFYARYEYNGRKRCGETSCVDCGTKLHSVESHSNMINYEDWKHVKHEMQFMKGIVTEVKSMMCCAVKWDNGWYFHHRQSKLRLTCQSRVSSSFISVSLNSCIWRVLYFLLLIISRCKASLAICD